MLSPRDKSSHSRKKKKEGEKNHPTYLKFCLNLKGLYSRNVQSSSDFWGSFIGFILFCLRNFIAYLVIPAIIICLLIFSFKRGVYI